jgi:small subunit ribosomal protein S9
MSPLQAAGQDAGTYDITVVVKGGGVSGQTGAVKLGLARALVALNSEWNSAMRKAGLLTRDARVKERKKPGLKRARKAPTYTKR